MNLPAALTDQAAHCEALGSPFMGRLLRGLAKEWPEGSALDQACATYQGDIGPGGHSLPLRIAGGLHALVLSGRDPELTAAYPQQDTDQDTLMRAVIGALKRNEHFLLNWIQSPPQTNEVRRSAAVIAAAHWISARHPLDIVTSELGASGGLNLGWDRYAMQIGETRLGADPAVLTLSPDWCGAPPPRPTAVRVAERAGVDLRPVDITDPDGRLRLQAYLWPDQPDRMALTCAAMEACTDHVTKGDAIDWLEGRLAAPRDGQLHMIYHTVAWQYFPQTAQARGTGLIEAAGALATPTAPLAWFGMENDGTGPGAVLMLRLWPGNQTVQLGRADFHGRWIDWAG